MQEGTEDELREDAQHTVDAAGPWLRGGSGGDDSAAPAPVPARRTARGHRCKSNCRSTAATSKSSSNPSTHRTSTGRRSWLVPHDSR